MRARRPGWSTSWDRLELHGGVRRRRLVGRVIGFRLTEWELDDDARAAPGCAFRARTSAVQRHELAYDGESDAAAASRGFRFAIEADVRLPDTLPIVVRNAGPLIFDPDASAFSNDLGSNQDDLTR